MNQCSFIGNLTRDPESRTTKNEKTVTNFSVAVNSGFGDSRETYYVNVVTFNKTAENCANFLAKGRQVAVVGRMRTQEWENADGEKRRRDELIANEVHFLSKGDGEAPAGGKKAAPKSETKKEKKVEISDIDDIDDDEIPF